MTVTPSDLAEFVADAQAAIHEEEQRLNAADAKLGDGDTGSMLCRVIDAMVGTDTVGAASLADAAMGLAQAAMKETGSSLGTLVATAAMALAKAAKSADGEIGASDMRCVALQECSQCSFGLGQRVHLPLQGWFFFLPLRAKEHPLFHCLLI